MSSTSTTQKSGLDLLQPSWKRAFLAGPWILLAGGFALVIASFVSSDRSTFGTACLTLGVATVVAGALLPRASGQFSVAGATANVFGVDEAIKAIAEIASATIPDTDPAKEEKVKNYVSAAASILSKSPGGADVAGSAPRREPTNAAISVGLAERPAAVSLPDLVKDVFGSA